MYSVPGLTPVVMEQCREFPELWLGRTDVPSQSMSGAVILALSDYLEVHPADVDLEKFVDIVWLDEVFKSSGYGESVMFEYEHLPVSITPGGCIRFFDTNMLNKESGRSTD